jgi:hypothetical protein
MSNMNKYGLALASLSAIILLLQVHNASALTISGKLNDMATVTSFDIFEVGIKLEEGQSITYSYSSSAPLLFTFHSHEGSTVITHFMTEGKNYDGMFTAPKSGDYYLLWENFAAMSHKITYSVGIPKSIHHVDYNGTIYGVEVISNSSVQNLQFDAAGKQLAFSLETPYLTPGFVSVTIPTELLSGEFSVEGADYLVDSTASHTSIGIDTGTGTHDIAILATNAVPEFADMLLMFLVPVALLAALRLHKSTLFRRN